MQWEYFLLPYCVTQHFHIRSIPDLGLQISYFLLFLFRSWQTRRVVWTSDLLVCAQLHIQTVIDAISLSEVVSVQGVHDDASTFGQYESKSVI